MMMMTMTMANTKTSRKMVRTNKAMLKTTTKRLA
jgi:hypothetical protein